MRRVFSLQSSIRKKIVLLTLGFALPPLLLIGWLGLNSLDRARDTALAEGMDALRTQAEATLEHRVQDKAKLYDSSLLSMQRQVEGVAAYVRATLNTAPSGINGKRVWVSPNGPTPANMQQHASSVALAQRLIPLVTTVVESNPLVNIGYVALEDGGVLAISDDAVIDALLEIAPFDPRLRPWYQEAQTHGKTIWTNTYVDANTGTLTTTCATPVYDDTGKLIGVVGFDLLLTTIQHDLLTVDIGNEGYAFLVNNAGDVVMRPNLEVGTAQWNEPFRTENLLESPDPALQAVAQRMLARERGIARIDYQGQQSYIAFAPIATAGWSVALVIPANEIVRPAIMTGDRIAERQRELWQQLLALLIIILILISAVGLMLALSFSRPIRALQQGARLVANGNLDHQLPAAGDDEIGQLVQSFNAMTVALRQKIAELETNAQQLAKLNAVSNQLKAILELPRLQEAITAAVCQQFGFERAVLYLVDRETRNLRAVSASFGPGHEQQARQFIAVANATPLSLDSASIEADIVRSGQAVIVNDPMQQQTVAHMLRPTASEISYVQVPIFGREGQVIGLLSADYQFSARPVTPQDASQLLMFANMVGLSIENVRLYDDLERQVAQRTEQLRAALEQAQIADRRKSDFLASVSHELRTPLNAIIGFSTVLLDGIDGPLSATQCEDVQSINRNGRFLLHLINDLLDLARIEAGHMTLDKTALDLHTLVTEVVDTIQALLRGRNILLRTVVPPDLPCVEADADRVRQIMLNLLSNAVKFTEEGSITISARTLEELGSDGQIRAYIAISVRDTGIGIPLELQGRVFEEFAQVHGRRSRVNGTGLGLSIARRLAEVHGGRIWMESMPGAGSTFTFTLPVLSQLMDSFERLDGREGAQVLI